MMLVKKNCCVSYRRRHCRRRRRRRRCVVQAERELIWSFFRTDTSVSSKRGKRRNERIAIVQ